MDGSTNKPNSTSLDYFDGVAEDHKESAEGNQGQGKQSKIALGNGFGLMETCELGPDFPSALECFNKFPWHGKRNSGS